jgi:hypothetical protein
MNLLRVHRSVAQSLDGRRSGGYSRHRCPTLYFQHVHAQQPPRLHGTTSERRFCRLAADSMHVHAQQPVNTSVFAPCGCRPLIPLWFPPGNFRLLYSSHSGVTCHPQPAAIGSVLFRETDYRCRRRRRRSSSAVSASAFAGRMAASLSSTSRRNSAAILATWTPNVPRSSPRALPNVQL